MNKEKNITFFRLATTAALFVSSASSCVEPTKTPNPTQTRTPETFTPTEKLESSYKAELIDFTSFIEENPSLVTQEVKDLNTTFQTLAHEIPGLKDVTPRIWTLSINDNGPKLDERLNIAQNEETNESYVLDIVTGEDSETKRTILQEQFFAKAEINANGEYTYVSYYYRDLDGNEVEFYKQNEDGTYTYTMLDGEKINLDGYANYFGNEDNLTTGGKHLSLIPPKDNLPTNLPEGAMINMELEKITNNQSETLYILENSIWVEIPEVPEDLISKLPEGITIFEGRLIDQSGVDLGEVIKGQDEGSFNLTFITTDFDDQIQEHSVNLNFIATHPSGAIILDSGERTGFVWKGDKWANILLEIQFQTDGTKFSEFPTITYEDIASGALAEAERLEAQPLPDKVVPITNYFIQTNMGYFILPELTNEQKETYFNDGATKPMRFEFFYNTEINNIPLIVATLQVKNSDNSFRLMHLAFEAKYFTFSYLKNNPETFEWWLGILNIDYKLFFDLSIFADSNASCDEPSYLYPDNLSRKVVCPLNQPNKEKLMSLAENISNTGNIPEEFDNVIFKHGYAQWY